MRYNLVKLDPLVNTIIEDIIYWHMRPEDPQYAQHSAASNELSDFHDQFHVTL